MFKNYFKTAFRNLIRERGSTFLNIAGLTLGISCSLVLFLLVRHMSTFDNFHTYRDQIYRVLSESDGHGERFLSSGVPPVLPDAFRNDFPEAEEVTFTTYRQNALISIPQRQGEPIKYMEEGGVVFAEPNFFKIFDRRILEGAAENGLDDPNEAIISESLAKKYFGEAEAIGQVVRFDTMEYRITAVMEDYPANTDLPFNLMLSYVSIKSVRDKVGWNSIWSDEHCYIKLRDGHTATSIEARMPDFVGKYLGETNYSHETYLLQPLRDMHFDDRVGTYSNSTAPRQMIVSLAVIAVFLIITACINFINLATAEAIKRSKEVGIRKSLGSTRGQLVGQFLGETSFVTIMAMLLSLGITQIALTFLNSFLDLKLSLNFANDGWLWVFIVGITVVVSILSGLYPSLVVSGFRPALALKNQISNRSSSSYGLRRTLVVLQFVISQFFIIGTIVLINQMEYFQKKELGFRKDAVLLIPIPEAEQPTVGQGTSKMRTLRDEVARIAGVEMTSLSSSPPSSGHVSGTGFIFEGEDESQRKDIQVKQVDGNYVNLFEIPLLAGAGVGDLDTAQGFLVNEQFVRAAGFQNPNDVVGKRIRVWRRTLPIVGVVQNFHTVSLHEPIEPTVLLNRISGYRVLTVKVNPARMQEAIEGIKDQWESTYPSGIFDYQFLDEHIRDFYQGEKRMSILLGIFTAMAIFIGCLGLFGLATFMANQKTKEIGVRKALGATVESIVFLFTREYVRLIVIGFVIATPLAWYVMDKWLSDFEYKITLGPAIFLLGLGISLAIAILTVGYKSLKAAIMNPVDSLRYE